MLFGGDFVYILSLIIFIVVAVEANLHEQQVVSNRNNCCATPKGQSYFDESATFQRMSTPALQDVKVGTYEKVGLRQVGF